MLLNDQGSGCLVAEARSPETRRRARGARQTPGRRRAQGCPGPADENPAFDSEPDRRIRAIPADSMRFRRWHPGCSQPGDTMRRLPGLRAVTMVAILLVATSLSMKGIGSSECECCGPQLTAPAAPVAPCCVGDVERRMATVTATHAAPGSPLPVTARPVPPVELEPAPLRGHPPGDRRPLYLRISLLRI